MVDPTPLTRDELQYKGWFWFCPIYLSDPEQDDLQVEARREWMEYVFDVAFMFEHARIWLSQALIPKYEPTFMFSFINKR